jgi:hypothetical protein
MFAKKLVLGLAVVGLCLVVALEPLPGRTTGSGTDAGEDADTLVGTVEIESLTVVSVVDDEGRELPPDSTLVPPVPLRGVRTVRVVLRGSQPDNTPAARALVP